MAAVAVPERTADAIQDSPDYGRDDEPCERRGRERLPRRDGGASSQTTPPNTTSPRLPSAAPSAPLEATRFPARSLTDTRLAGRIDGNAKDKATHGRTDPICQERG